MPSLEQINESFNIMQSSLMEHNIFLVWDCEIIPLKDNTLYNWSNPIGLCNFEQFYTGHADGIDIIIGGDNAYAYGFAKGIPGDILLIKGSQTLMTFNGQVTTILSRSSIISHEMGHCLGLWHTFHGGESGINCDNSPSDLNVCPEFVNGSNGQTCGDYVSDTPADTYPPFGAVAALSSNCVYDFEDLDPNGQLYAPKTDLFMSYTYEGCMTHHTIGQGERMRRIISISPILQACLVNPDFLGYTVTTNTVWKSSNTPNGGSFLIEGDLVIESGITLTIDAGVTVHFGEQSKLIIKPNATLVLNGTLTGIGCKGFTWQGVRVWGSNPSQSQFVLGGIRAQGLIHCNSGSLIENANVGVQLYGPTYAFAGGQISCSSGTTIKNCKIGVEFAPYQNFWPFSNPVGQQGQPRGYKGYFIGTTFLTDNDYPHNDAFYAFVYMTGVNKVRLSGCTYTNARTISGSSIADWGYGIFANDAEFSVTAIENGNTYPPSSYNFSEFSGLGYGIYTSRVVTNRPYLIKQANFKNCFVGIRNKTVTGGTLLFNNFNLGELPSTDPTSDQVGVIFETDVAGFTCEENDFINYGGNAETTIGTICINTGIANKTIRKNKFDGLTFGNIANQVNASNLPQDGIRGLYYDCNKNFDVLDMDFSVPDGRIKTKQGLEKDNQGQITYGAAGNHFSYTEIDFSNSGSAIEYFFNLNGLNEEPLATQGNFTKTSTNETNTCPTTYCEPPCKPRQVIELFKSDFYVKRSNYYVVKSNYIVNPTEANARQMAYYQRVMDEDAYIVVIHELYDTTSFNADTLRTWIGNMGSLEGDLWLADERLGIGNSSAAIALLNAAMAKYQLTEDEQSDIANYKSLVNILAGKSWYSLDEATLQSVKGYLAANGHSESWAKSIVTLYGGHFPAEYIKSGIRERSNDGQIASGKLLEKWLIVQPNPAKDFVEFSFSLPKEAVGASIRIYGMNGRLLLQQTGLPATGLFTWKTSTNPSGVYFYHLQVNGVALQSGKIILNK